MPLPVFCTQAASTAASPCWIAGNNRARGPFIRLSNDSMQAPATVAPGVDTATMDDSRHTCSGVKLWRPTAHSATDPDVEFPNATEYAMRSILSHSIAVDEQFMLLS